MGRSTARTPRGEGAALRGRLVAAATRLVAEHGGTEAVSIRMVTKAAGVSPMAFYLHFPDRDALLREVVDRGFDAFREAIEAARDRHEDPRDRLRAMGAAYLAFARDRPAIYAVIFGGRHDAPATAAGPPPDTPGGRAFAALVEAVAACGPPGGDPLLPALGLWTALHGFVGLRAAKPGMTWPEDAEWAAVLLGRWVPEDRPTA